MLSSASSTRTKRKLRGCKPRSAPLFWQRQPSTFGCFPAAIAVPSALKFKHPTLKQKRLFLKWPKYFLWLTDLTASENDSTTRFRAGLPWLSGSTAWLDASTAWLDGSTAWLDASTAWKSDFLSPADWPTAWLGSARTRKTSGGRHNGNPRSPEVACPELVEGRRNPGPGVTGFAKGEP